MREKKGTRRILAWALAVVMVLGIMPVSAVAEITEQFTLTPGGTYYFDLSGANIPGTKNTVLPDSSLKWVPFTYAGTVNAYSLTAPSNSGGTASDRSLFVADLNVTHTVSWNNLNAQGLIFGRTCDSGGVDYTLRSLSVGSSTNGETGNYKRGTPLTNEWDQILDKGAYIKRYFDISSWGQDTDSANGSKRAERGLFGARYWDTDPSSSSSTTWGYVGFRPALEILNPDMLDSDALKTVTYDMGSYGTLGSGSLTSAAVVYTGTLTLPEITSANGFNSTGPGDLGWYDGDGNFYPAGMELANLPTGTTLTAGYVREQFTLTPGGTYYFDLSGENIPGTKNTALPDSSLKWAPFTYAGTVNAYSLTAPSNSGGTASDRSLFVADFNVTCSVSWDDLNAQGLIFGKTCDSGGVDYTLCSLSAGSSTNGQSGDNMRGTPLTNEWDRILDKGAYIKNYSNIYSWGQDTDSASGSERAVRGYSGARSWSNNDSGSGDVSIGFRPALEILNTNTPDSDALRTVTYDMGSNGTLGSGSLTSATVVYTGTLTLPEIRTENGFTYTGATGAGALGWYDERGSFYQSGIALAGLPTGTTLTAGYGVPNANLQKLEIGTGVLSPAFDANTAAYSVQTAEALNSIEITAVAIDPDASMTIGGQAAQSGTPVTVALENGANLIPVIITAPDGTTQKAYIISVNGTVSDADLSGLSLSAGTLNFSAATTDYYLTVGSDVTSLDLTASASDSKAVMLLNGAILPQGGMENIPLSAGDNTVTLMVIAQDATTKTYTVTISRGNSDATLSGLALSGGTLSPAFGRTVYAYTATVGNAVTDLTVTPTASDNAASVTVNGQPASKPVSLSVGSNTVTIQITGSDGVTTKTYTVTVTRRAAITITNLSLPVGIVGGDYRVAMTAVGGAGSFTWSATGLPASLSLDSATGVLSGTPLDADKGAINVTFTATDANAAAASQSYTLVIQEGCGGGAYRIVSDGDAAYTGSYTADGIPTLTVNSGVSGFTYFGVDISAVTGHAGSEVCVFVQMRGGEQIGFSFNKADYDTVSAAGAAFNVRAGDVVKVYIVDTLTNGAGSNPTVL